MRLGNITYKKISSKEELKESLNRYKRILNPRVIDYLNQLVELEFSAVKDIIDIEDREILQNLDLYKNIVAYNIYNRTLELLNNEQELKIFDNKDRISGLMAYKDIGNPAIRILDYNYENGALKLFQTVYDKKVRKEQLELVMTKLEQLYDKKNPYHSDLELFGCPATRWNIDYIKEVSEYEKLFTRLDSKKELTDYKKKKIGITKKYHDLLFEEYGLTDEEFIVSKQTPATIDNIINKTLVKKLPGLRIENNIEYV
ncbi:hypothetical protein EGP98_04960 [bacterium]|nr:hypothetical protein [bacterium]